MDEKLCEADPEGISYAAVINEHLPEYVRVFSVQRVSKKYNCRWVQPGDGSLRGSCAAAACCLQMAAGGAVRALWWCDYV